MLYIHPEECIDCGACVPACPVAAIYESIDATPSHQKDLIEANAIYRNGDRRQRWRRPKRSSRRTSPRIPTSWRSRPRNGRPRTRASEPVISCQLSLIARIIADLRLDDLQSDRMTEICQ